MDRKHTILFASAGHQQSSRCEKDRVLTVHGDLLLSVRCGEGNSGCPWPEYTSCARPANSTPRLQHGLTILSAKATLKPAGEGHMAKLALVYGMRLLPEEDLGEVKDATVVLKNGRSARVAMHLISGTKEEIEATFRESIEAFFDLYPEI